MQTSRSRVRFSDLNPNIPSNQTTALSLTNYISEVSEIRIREAMQWV
jgi:hypothetical protein